MFEVKQSPIHGRGLFATEFIPAGILLGNLEGFSVDDDGPYVLWVDGVQGFCVTNDFKYINHNNNANSAYYDDLTVVTLRDIYPGEEITHDYRGDDKDTDEEMVFDDMLEPA
ncbi:MAG: SET domain-containing protein-lysine N-methyltransferase [Phycisphaeraceae bacterium]|nr:SET domain-containing protein-lysine N-methyltransferase [Phycisphaeraceae bacterium]|tara:strand:+ start:55 stop:390 length:336 start_codon:yes stop_codon:yes gene_type:complete